MFYIVSEQHQRIQISVRVLYKTNAVLSEDSVSEHPGIIRKVLQRPLAQPYPFQCVIVF